MSQPGVCFSVHLSGIVNGLTQFIAFAGEASAVAVAPMSAVCMPKNFAISVDTGLPRAVVRNTSTLTRLNSPELGSGGNVTSVG